MKVDYIAFSVPLFFILIGIELAYTFCKKLVYYGLNDSTANLNQELGQQITGSLMKMALFFGYAYISNNFRLFTIPDRLRVWILLFLVVDFKDLPIFGKLSIINVSVQGLSLITFLYLQNFVYHDQKTPAI